MEQDTTRYALAVQAFNDLLRKCGKWQSVENPLLRINRAEAEKGLLPEAEVIAFGGKPSMRKINLNFMAALRGAAMGLVVTLAQAGHESDSYAVGKKPGGIEDLKPSEPPAPVALPKSSERSAIRSSIEQETLKTNLSADIAEAVVYVESSYNASTIGRAGEIGLMQVRLGTAAMLDFKGSAAELLS